MHLTWRWQSLARQLSALRWRYLVWREHHQDALRELEHWIERAVHPVGVPSNALATRAHLLAAVDCWAAAAQQLRVLSALEPGEAKHHFNLGYTLQRIQAWTSAEGAFRQALALAPRMDLAWFGLGEVLSAQGRYAEAELAWLRQSELQPFCPDGLERLVKLYVQQGQWQQAEHSLARLMSFAPRRALALESLRPGGDVWSQTA